MEVRDDFGDGWTDAPDAPPVHNAGTIAEPLEPGMVIRDREDSCQYIYAAEGVAHEAGRDAIPSV